MKPAMRIEIDEKRLSPGERRFLRDIMAKTRPTRPDLPPGYAEELERVYGDCPAPVDRWQVLRNDT
jgi:hypothetical protein